MKIGLGSRLRRYTRVGTSLGGLAVQLGANRVLGTKLDQGKHAAALKDALGDLKGPLMKAAQLLASIPDALPKEYSEDLRQLQSNAPPMGWTFVKRRMKSELGPDWQSKFTSFERDAAAGCFFGGKSIGAVLPDGTDVACKLQYPDMSSAVEADLRQLGLGLWRYTAVTTKPLTLLACLKSSQPACGRSWITSVKPVTFAFTTKCWHRRQWSTSHPCTRNFQANAC